MNILKKRKSLQQNPIQIFKKLKWATLILNMIQKLDGYLSGMKKIVKLEPFTRLTLEMQILFRQQSIWQNN
ncbi:hypothetical protein ALO_03646 [Acetonema longum DSM 6540]|uniref:Uncharacterized protein n=1 Tax=Acetonema longum DSM 6540 TaxID=1009370 RepID=F7NFA2_9FIRM|nr:hypothetical protein ALO_03646 [Acetonema longum DSM 6540]